MQAVPSTGLLPCAAPPAPQNKPKPHRCLTDCCAGYIDRVYIRQGGDGPGAKVLYHYDMYTMDQATRQLIEAEAAKRRKRPGAVRTARRDGVCLYVVCGTRTGCQALAGTQHMVRGYTCQRF